MQVATTLPVTGNGEPVYQRERFLLLIVEPERHSAGIAAELAAHNVDVVVCADAAEALIRAGRERPDAVLAAARPSNVDSVVLVRALAHSSAIPVVVGIGDGDGDAATATLAAGAAACVARPYRPRELLPILQAIRPDLSAAHDPPVRAGDLRLDPATLEAHLGELRIRLRLREFNLLHMLVVNANRIVPREKIITRLWGGNDRHQSNSLTVHIRRLRRHLGDHPTNPTMILTIRGIGYRLVPPHENRTRRAARR
jgi:DNA-binding response OmpR family regulator